jgi:SAM-dependent methyltransferase
MTEVRHGNATQREVEFFDKFVAEHGDYDVLDDGAYARIRDAFIRTVRPKAGDRCIDLGCGTGAFTRRLRGLDLKLTGMDISPVSVEHAKKIAPDVDYIVGDITDTKLADGSFDVVLYSGVLHHFSTHEGRLAVMREGLRLLAPGGRLFAYDPSAQSPSMWLYRDPRSPLFSEKGKTENEVLLHRKELAAELREVGFVNVEIRGLAGITFAYVESRLASVILPLYNAYEQLLRYSPFENRLGTFLITLAHKA